MMKIQNLHAQPPSQSLRKNKKVEEVTHEIIELLTGEVPMKYQDATSCFAMEQWEYLEGHKDHYKDVMMRNQPPRPSLGGNQNAWRKHMQTWGEHVNFMQEASMVGLQTSSLQDGSSNRNTPNRGPCPPYSLDTTQERHKIPHCYQALLDAHQNENSAEAREEEEISYVISDDDLCKEEEVPPEISPDPRNPEAFHIDISAEEEEEVICVKIEEDEMPISIGADGRGSGYNPKKHHNIFPEGEMNNNDVMREALEINPSTPNLHPVLLCENLLSLPSTRRGSLSSLSTPVTHHPNQRAGAVFQCSICGKCFSWKGSLVEHQRIHTGEKPYSCSECGKCFSKKTKLTLHQRTHTGEKPFSCSECGKRFTRRDHLNIHQRTHTGVKPYSCSECGKCFSQRAFLIVHQRAHAGLKPYSCSECGKSFTGKAHLIVHQRTHTGEKPHLCSECGKSFTERSQLLRHRMSHSGVRPYVCPVCGRSFSSKSSLVRHQHVHTNINPLACPE